MDIERAAFALPHLYVYPQVGIAYTFIPKNACTSMKRTLGEAEGWWSDDGTSVHTVAKRQWLGGLLRYRSVDEHIVILRDPWDRLLSAYQNRLLVRRDRVSSRAMERGLAEKLPDGARRGDVSFRDFLEYLARTPSRRLDAHWRPQVDFLWGSYTRILRFDHLTADSAFLADHELSLHRADGHGTSALRRDVGPGWGHRPARALRKLKEQEGVLPAASSMYDDELRNLVAHRFAADVELWQRVASDAAARAGKPSGH
jgi:hypothetical protein